MQFCSVSRTQICVLLGLGQRLNKQKPGISEAVEIPGFSHLYIQMHCLLLFRKWFILIDFVFKGGYPMKNRLNASRTICKKYFENNAID